MAWWHNHGISRATYMEWKRQAKLRYLNLSHGNPSLNNPSKGTIVALIRENADLMSNQIK